MLENRNMVALANSVIHKQVLTMPTKGGFVEVMVPDECHLLNFGLQEDSIVIWYGFKEEKVIGMVKRRVRLLNTGEHHIPSDNMHYVNTLTTSNGIVWHCFAETGLVRRV